jgi:hypothetical protein
MSVDSRSGGKGMSGDDERPLMRPSAHSRERAIDPPAARLNPAIPGSSAPGYTCRQGSPHLRQPPSVLR